MSCFGGKSTEARRMIFYNSENVFQGCMDIILVLPSVWQYVIMVFLFFWLSTLCGDQT